MICNLLDIHPMTAEQLVRIGMFPTRKNALRRLLKLVRKKQIKQCPPVLLHPKGRPENVYCRWMPKSDNVRHEVILTEFLLPFRDAHIVRGYDVQNALKPDAILFLNGQEFLVEMDCGTMSYREVSKKRFRKYEEFDGIVLWVCLTDTRKEGLRSRAEKIKHNALFTTLFAHLTEPFGGVWIDYDGEIASVGKTEEERRA